MSTNKRDLETEEFIRSYEERQDKLTELQEQLDSLPVLGTEWDSVKNEYDQLDKEHATERMEMINRTTAYHRPNGMISGLFTRMLAPLPKNIRNTIITDHADETFKSFPSYWGTAIGTLVAFIASISALLVMVPQLFVSPLSFAVGFISTGSATDESTRTSSTSGVVMTIFVVVVIVVGLCALRSRKSVKRFVYNAAHQEEKWFRSGAENWTTWQRIVSCLSFGLCHIINIIYPIVTLLLLSVVGAVFMTVYLKEYRRSHDTYRATLASTKLHARYNICVFWFVVAGLALYGVLYLINLFM